MSKGYEVLEMLCPEGGWIISGDNFNDVEWVDERPKCTKAQFDAGFAKYDSWKAEQDNAKAIIKAELLSRLGITAEEAVLLLS